MSEQRGHFVRKGMVGTCAVAALLLLASFYSIVSGAVDRAARQRLAVAHGVAGGAPLAGTLRAAPRARSLLARVDN